MENGPAMRTRSLTQAKSDIGTSESNQPSLIDDTAFSDTDIASFNPHTQMPCTRAKTKKVARTPSGQPISSSVKDIRNFFQHEVKTKSQYLIRTSDSQDKANTNSQTDSSSNSLNRESVQQSVERLTTSTIDYPTVTDGLVQFTPTVGPMVKTNIKAKLLGDQSQHVVMMEQDNYGLMQVLNKLLIQDELTKKKSDLKERKVQMQQKQEEYKRNEASQLEKERQQFYKVLSSEAKEIQQDENPQVMDIRVVMEMFPHLKASMNINGAQEAAKRIADMETSQLEQAEHLIKIETELAQVQIQNEILKGVVARMEDIIQVNERKVDMLEYNNMKRSMVLTGFHTNTKRDVFLRHLYSFLKDEMRVEVQVEDFFYINKESTSPMVITFASLEDKKEIFCNLKSLKGLRNEFDKPLIFTDYLPPAMNEAKRRERDIFKMYSDQGPDSDVKVEWKNGRVHVNEKVYEKRITPPNAKQLLDISAEEID